MWVVGGVAVLAVVAVVVVTVLAGGGSSESSGSSEDGTGPSRGEVVEVAKLAGVGSPRRPVLPPADDPAAVVAYVEGDGSDLVEVHSLLVDLLRSGPPDQAACLDRAGRLDEVVDPAELYRLAGQVPDGVTSELFIDLAASTNRFLAACGDGDEVLRGELAYQWVLVDRRLDELGVGS